MRIPSLLSKMSSCAVEPLPAVAWAWILSLACGLTVAQDKAANQVAVNSPPGQAAYANRSEGEQGSIKVHGHWTITVRNQDGSVSSHHEFNNSLRASQLFSALFIGQQVDIDSYVITLNTEIGDGICGTPSAPRGCTIHEGAGTNTSTEFYGLRVNQVNAAVVLTGTAKTTSPGTISFVATSLKVGNGGSHDVQYPLTARDLTVAEPPAVLPPAPIHVVAGQSIDVTVTISFS